MQDCFRQHPDVYGAELEDDDVEGGAPTPTEQVPSAAEQEESSNPEEKRSRAKEVNAKAKADNAAQGESAETDTLLPKAAYDAEEKNQSKQA